MNVDADNDGRAWGFSSLYAYSLSWDDDAINPDNWLITPKIDLPENSTLTFDYRCFTKYGNENLGIYISTTDTEVSSFIKLEDRNDGTTTEMLSASIDLSNYTGPVYLAFRHYDSTDLDALELKNVKITAASSGSESEVLTVEDNFTNSSYFEGAGITVTPSETDLSFTVACDNACVVAKDNGNGTYTPLTGTAVEGKSNTYSFAATSASDKIVVALKGDVIGNGAIDNKDVLRMKQIANNVGTAMTDIEKLTADIVGTDGTIDNKDVLKLKQVANSTGTAIAW